jgi:tRNA 2-selenouridine synthase
LKKIRSGKRILVTGSLEARRNRILTSYTNNLDIKTINPSQYLSKLKERLGAKRTAELIETANRGEFTQLIDALLVEYYDPLYRRPIEQGRPYDFEVNGDDPKSAARSIYERYCLNKSYAQIS